MKDHRAAPRRVNAEELTTDLEFVRSVLVRFPNPWDRYLLTLSLDATADTLEELHDKSDDHRA